MLKEKKIKSCLSVFYKFLLLFLFISSCGDDDVNPNVQTANSQLCNEVVGPKAIYWDISNGIPRTDLPNGLPPVVNNIGGTFSHPDFPLLGFNYPVGWNPVALRGPGTVGVNLVRQDGNGLWRWFSTPVNGFVGARQLRDFEITQMKQNLGLSNNVTTVCVNEGSVNTTPGIIQSFSNILITADGFTALIAANTTNVESLPNSTFTNVQVAIGPSATFDELIFDVYLAIGFQLLYGGEKERDSDGDGTIDALDRFPNDPTRA
ncbi:hypothetical protein [Flexithrix dorotheae]|uniref:hypothetical protein n=1 Tax=Flexithrix dorotheae TaxID=70993 RepID=UPI000372F8D6|nr:hypothetical protein [Flexithrix dorotheae]